MKLLAGINISPIIRKMPTIVFTKSPVPMPRPYSPSPVYSQRPPSKSPTPRPHIMPIQKADMIPSYSASSTSSIMPSPSSSQLLRQKSAHTHSLIISFLQAVGTFGVLILFAIVIWAISGELRKIRHNTKQKRKEDLTQSELIIQQINPTAYSKLNLIHRGSSNSLSSSGNISPV